MADAGQCVIFSNGLQISDVLSIAGIIVNCVLASWIVGTVEKRAGDKRYQKEYLINEVKEIRADYGKFFSDIHTGKLYSGRTISWFKFIDIKIKDLLDILSSKYDVEKDFFNPYRIELNTLVTNNNEFIDAYKTDKPVNFSDASIREFYAFQANYSGLFNKLIMDINDK